MHNTSCSSVATIGGDANLSEIAQHFSVPSVCTQDNYSAKKRRLFGDDKILEETKDLYKQLKLESKLVVNNERESRNGHNGCGGLTAIQNMPKAKTFFCKPAQKVIFNSKGAGQAQAKVSEEKPRFTVIQHVHSHSQPGNLQNLFKNSGKTQGPNIKPRETTNEALIERMIKSLIESYAEKRICQLEQQIIDLAAKLEYLARSTDLKLELHQQQMRNQVLMTFKQQRQVQSQCLCSTLRLKATRQDSSFLKYLEKEGDQFSNLNNFKLSSSDFLLSLSNSSQQIMRDQFSIQLQELQQQVEESELVEDRMQHQSLHVPGASIGGQELRADQQIDRQEQPRIEMIPRLNDQSASISMDSRQMHESDQQVQAHETEQTDELLYNSNDFQYLDYSATSPSLSIFEARNLPQTQNAVEILELRLSHLD